MKFSIIIPCHNDAAYLGEQLDAIAKQESEADFEVIVIDNNSTDNPRAVVEQYHDRIDELQIIAAHNGVGGGYARNIGCEFASGSFFLFCDADDVVRDDWLLRMQRAAREHMLITGPVDYDRLNTASGTKGEMRSELRTDAYLDAMPHGLGGNLGIHREVHEAIGGFDETLLGAEDVDYTWRAQIHGYQLAFDREIYIHYRLRPRSSAVISQMARNGRNAVAVYAKHRRHFPHPKNWKQGARRWQSLILDLPMFFDAEKRARWTRRLGYAIGLLQGSLRHRIAAW